MGRAAWRGVAANDLCVASLSTCPGGPGGEGLVVVIGVMSARRKETTNRQAAAEGYSVTREDVFRGAFTVRAVFGLLFGFL